MARLHTCPKCRALLEPGTKRCPYCETDTRHVGAPTEAAEAQHTFRLANTILWINATIFLLVVLLDPAKEESEGFAVEPSNEAS